MSEPGWWPAAGQTMFTSRVETMPPEPVTQGQDGRYRDSSNTVFRGWIWRGQDGNHYGQRKAA